MFVQPNASAPAPIRDVVGQLGGHVDFDLPNWLVITIPEVAFQAIRQHPAVKYLQRVVSGPFVESTTVASNTHHATTTGRITPNSLPPWTSGTYKYDGAGNISAIGNDVFTYDQFSRLVQANIKDKTETYVYDVLGNLTRKTTHDPAKMPPDLPVDLTTDIATNHLSAYQPSGYDSAGNLTGDSSETNTFDPVNMQREKDVSGLAEVYVYNAADERIGVFECSGPPTTCINAPVIWSLRDEAGKVLRQYQSTYVQGGSPQFAPPWAWLEDYIYRDGSLLGAERVPEEGGRRHFHLDHLGTPRLVTGDGGARIAEHDYYPFGVEITPVPQETTVSGYDREEPMKFTGHLRDFNSGTSSDNANYNDFMHARNTVPQWGRFLSVDSVINVEGATETPQKWNRYSYTLNNPLRYFDPNGKAENDFRCVECKSAEARAGFQQGINAGMKWGAVGVAAFLAVAYAPEIISTATTAFLSNPAGITNTIATALTPGPAGEMPNMNAIEKIAEYSKGDATIFKNAMQEAGTTARGDFMKHIDVLLSEVRKVVPDGQVYKLGTVNGQAVYGSTRTGVGIVQINEVTKIVKRLEDGRWVILGDFR